MTKDKRQKEEDKRVRRVGGLEGGKVEGWNDLLGLRWRAGGGLTGLRKGKKVGR